VTTGSDATAASLLAAWLGCGSGVMGEVEARAEETALEDRAAEGRGWAVVDEHRVRGPASLRHDPGCGCAGAEPIGGAAASKASAVNEGDIDAGEGDGDDVAEPYEIAAWVPRTVPLRWDPKAIAAE